MARSRRRQSSIAADLLGALSKAPVWAGPLLALAVFVVFRWVFPGVLDRSVADDPEGRQRMTQVFSGFSARLSPLFGAVVLFIWGLAEGKKWADRRQLDQQSGPESINALSWTQFESLLSEAFRRQGFAVNHSGKPGPDGGVDLRLTKAGAITLVQCKHWKKKQVGVTIVRELLGVVSSEGAQAGIVVTSGEFTPETIAFAARNPIRLINGRELNKMLGDVQKSGRIKDSVPEPAEPQQVPPAADWTTSELKCPTCGSAMVRRVAKKGSNAGSEFWGCPRYPACRGTRPIEEGAR